MDGHNVDSTSMNNSISYEALSELSYSLVTEVWPVLIACMLLCTYSFIHVVGTYSFVAQRTSFFLMILMLTRWVFNL